MLIKLKKDLFYEFPQGQNMKIALRCSLALSCVLFSLCMLQARVVACHRCSMVSHSAALRMCWTILVVGLHSAVYFSNSSGATGSQLVGRCAHVI